MKLLGMEKKRRKREKTEREIEREEREMASFGRMSCWPTAIVDRQKCGRQLGGCVRWLTVVSLHRYFGQVIIGRLFNRHYQVIIGHGMSCINLPSELL